VIDRFIGCTTPLLWAYSEHLSQILQMVGLLYLLYRNGSSLRKRSSRHAYQTLSAKSYGGDIRAGMIHNGKVSQPSP
jgi:threonine/homoserine/homoserine lactone efflux protein